MSKKQNQMPPPPGPEGPAPHLEQKYAGAKTATWALIGIFVAVSVFLIVFQFVRGELGFAWRGFLFVLFLAILPLFRWVKLEHSWRLYIFTYLFLLYAFSFGCIYGSFTVSGVTDKVSHFVSGIFFTILGFCVYYWLADPHPGGIRGDAPVAVTYALFFSMFIAAFWEVLEFLDFTVLGNDSQKHLTTGVFDTMYDIIFCLIGSLLSVGAYVLWHKKGVRLLTPWVVEEFYEKNAGARRRLGKDAKRGGRPG